MFFTPVWDGNVPNMQISGLLVIISMWHALLLYLEFCFVKVDIRLNHQLNLTLELILRLEDIYPTIILIID